MPLVPMSELLADAERDKYAVGYFESWNLESLQATIDAAEKTRSPVIIGFSGLFLSDPKRVASEELTLYSRLGRAAAEAASVPCALIFNECPDRDWVNRAAELGFGAVMFADESVTGQELVRIVSETVSMAHSQGVEVEAELGILPFGSEDASQGLTDPEEAASFVEETGVDALAVSVGNVHVLKNGKASLNLDHVQAIREKVQVPLVLHGGTGIDDESLRAGIQQGISKVNIGTVLKMTFLQAMKNAMEKIGDEYDPHSVLGGGGREDVLVSARLALGNVIAGKMKLFGSAGQASG